MADEPSIDEILESLDHLLKDGAGKNDDFSDDGQDEAGDAYQQSESQDDEVRTPEQPVAEAIAEADDSSVSDAGGTSGSGHLLADMEEGAPHPSRMLLSESMLVDNPQEHLPFDNKTTVEPEGSGADDDSEGTETAPAQLSAPEDTKIGELARHVSDELVRRLHEQLGEVLPGMVNDAVRQYMEELKPEDKKT